MAREYGSTSAVPVLGRAVQAPIVSVPRSVPRVAVIHVAPRPTTVARISASKVMKISRTVSSCAALASRGCPGTAAAKLSGERDGVGGHRLDRFRRVAGGLGRIVEQFLDMHQDVRTAFGEDRRRPA